MTDRDGDDSDNLADVVGKEVRSTLEETFDQQDLSAEKRGEIKTRLNERFKSDPDKFRDSGFGGSEGPDEENTVDRRGFLKVLGGIAAAMGLGGLAEKVGAIQFKSDKGINYNGNQVWHAGNDGSGSNLNADTVDGKEASELGGEVNSTPSAFPGTLNIDSNGNIRLEWSNSTTFQTNIGSTNPVTTTEILSTVGTSAKLTWSFTLTYDPGNVYLSITVSKNNIPKQSFKTTLNNPGTGYNHVYRTTAYTSFDPGDNATFNAYQKGEFGAGGTRRFGGGVYGTDYTQVSLT